ncbi:MAG TPA: hypothetical protein VK083_08635 [Nocardia sp.]|uniref:hypothetical protein n=1 Tax=Nocardia TaxID=1817 RepID=UPI00245382E2|nr:MULTISPECIES: hypothetical protein [Nocardia]HLS76838.1 hypothetical protein [Nocardia sp.]
MTDPATERQLRRLAELLHVDVDRVEFLAPLGARELAVLREHTARDLHRRYPRAYRRIIRMGRLAPMRLAAPFATRVLPPRMLGRAISGGVLTGRTERAAALIGRLPPELLADLAPYLDPAIITTLLDITPPELLGGVVNELMAREDYDTADLFAAQFTAALTGGAPAPGVPRSAERPRGLRRLLPGRRTGA